MTRKTVVTLTVDKGSLALLEAIATQETEGNRSLTVRKLIRAAAKERGVTVPVAEEAAAEGGR